MRYCLIIDDVNQEEEISILETNARKNAFPIKCYYFKPGKECLREDKKPDGTVMYFLDKELVWQELKKAFPREQIDLIAVDYTLSDEYTTGLEIVQFLKENNWRGNTPYVIYSGDDDKIKEKLKEKVAQIFSEGDKDELSRFIQSYHILNPSKIYHRGNIDDASGDNTYMNHIFEFIKTHKTPMNIKLSRKLNELPENIFRNIFPRFEGKKLGYLANLVLEERKEESDVFEDEFIDRCVDHFIKLKE